MGQGCARDLMMEGILRLPHGRGADAADVRSRRTGVLSAEVTGRMRLRPRSWMRCSSPGLRMKVPDRFRCWQILAAVVTTGPRFTRKIEGRTTLEKAAQ